MHRIAFIFILIFCLFIASCNEVYRHHVDDFPNFGWEKQRVLEYDLFIEDSDSDYELIISFRHIYGFTFESVPVSISIEGSEGKVFESVENIIVFDSNNKMLSECAGDYCDLDQALPSPISFQAPGAYTISLQHQFEADVLPYVMEVGIILDKKDN